MTQSKARERRAALLREFEISGLSLAEFRRRAGLAYSTVLAWRRRTREEEVAPSPASPGFVVVEALPADGEAGCGGSTVMDGRTADHGAANVVMKRHCGMGQGAEAPEPGGCGHESSTAAVGRAELALPGGLTLRIYGECPDRGGGRSCHERSDHQSPQTDSSLWPSIRRQVHIPARQGGRSW